jgi:ankyrin repeat protein
MSLSNLPTELLSHLAEYITSLQSLAGLASMNRRLYTIFDPLLYQRDATSRRSLALDWAAKNGGMKILNKALEHGAEVPHPCRPKISYCTELYLNYGCRICDVFKYTPPHSLCISVAAGNEAIVEFLLARGSDPNMRGSQNLSVLSTAVALRNLRLVEILLAAGANQFWCRPLENYPLQIAAYLGNKDLFYLLLYHNPQGLRAQRDIWDSLESALRGKNYDLIPSLLEFQVNLNSCFGTCYTLLSLAVEFGDFNTVKLFLDKGADPSFPRHGYWESGEEWKGEPALVKAVARGDEAIVQLLLEGSDRTTRTRALSLSMKQVDERISRIILAHGCAVDFEFGDYMYHQYNPDDKHDYGLIAPIVRAINARNADMVRLLVNEKGASVNVLYRGLYESQSRQSQGSALQLAIDLDQIDIIQFLRENGAQEEAGSWEERWKNLFFEWCTAQSQS